AHVSLMFQPEHNLVGVLTAAAREGRQAPSFERVWLSTDALALRGSVSEARLTELGARKTFDRTSLTLAAWLSLSEQTGGAPAIWPNSPPIPVPGVERLGGAQRGHSAYHRDTAEVPAMPPSSNQNKRS